MRTATSIKCRLCGRHANQIEGWLTRVNEKGVKGIWECRPSCRAVLTPEERLLGAVKGVERT